MESITTGIPIEHNSKKFKVSRNKCNFGVSRFIEIEFTVAIILNSNFLLGDKNEITETTLILSIQ